MDMQFNYDSVVYGKTADADSQKAPKRRGRPKGSRSASLDFVRKQANAEKRQLKIELEGKITLLQNELKHLRSQYEHDVSLLSQEVEVLRRREENYRNVLDKQLCDVADHLRNVLINWGSAELEQAQVDKRRRGRPRKTLR